MSHSSHKSMSYSSHKSMSYSSHKFMSYSSHKSMSNSSNKSMSSNHTMRQSSSDNSYSVTVGSMKSIGMIRYCSHIGSKSLGLGHCSVFSLERLGDRLVGSLTSTKTTNYSTYKGTPTYKTPSTKELGGSIGGDQ